jgi:hypothetical protein
VEVDDEHAVVWTRPRDLDYDPADPARGLGRGWVSGPARLRGCLVGLADASVRSVVVDQVEPEGLRALFAGEGDADLRYRGLPWYAPLVRAPLRSLVLPSLFLGLAMIAGAVPIVLRLLRGKAVSPGEHLWLILAATLLAYWLAFPFLYRLRLFGGASPEDRALWVVPRLAGLLAGAGALYCQRSSLPWATFWVSFFWLWVLALAQAVVFDPDTTPEDSLVTGAPPLLLALLGLLAGMMTGAGFPAPRRAKYGLLHWAGIVACFVPLTWLVVCCASELTCPLVKVRE